MAPDQRTAGDEQGARFLRYHEIPDAEQLTVGAASPEAREKAAQAAAAGVRRKQVTEGEVGVHSHIAELPAGYEVAPHSHDHDEMIVVLQGTLAMSGGPELGPSDVALLKAGEAYGFAAGPDGLRFLNVRQGKASIQMEARS